MQTALNPGSNGTAPMSPHPTDLTEKFIELEHNYLTESSFHSDALRNQFIEFYLLIAGAAGTAVVGLAQMQDKNSPPIPTWALGGIAVFIGLIGFIMIPIFVRLRRNVLECLQGTVLIKRYVEQHCPDPTDFRRAMLWDSNSLPRDESYVSASFLLIFVFMVLDSAMFALAALVWGYRPEHPMWAVLWSAALGVFLLTFEVIFYRWRLYAEIKSANDKNNLKKKWKELDLKDWQEPILAKPLSLAFGIGGSFTIALLILAAQV